MRDDLEDFNLNGWDSHDENDEPLLTDLGAGDWLPVANHPSSPITVGDTLFVGSNPTEVVSISPSQIQTRNIITSELRNIQPAGQFFRDDSGMLAEGRKSTRTRKKTAFYTYDKPGGEIERNTSRKCDDGLDLVGQKFWNADSSEEMPKCFIVLGARNHQDGSQTHKVLDYALEDDQKGKLFFSKVCEVRKWMQDSLSEPPGQSPVHVSESVNEDILEPPSNSMFEEKGVGNLRAATTFKVRDDVAKCIRSKIKSRRRFRRPKKIPRRVIISVLRGKIKKSFFKSSSPLLQ